MSEQRIINDLNIINDLQDVIIGVYCESEIINNADRRHLVKYTKAGRIDIVATWSCAIIFVRHDEIKKQIKHCCDFDTVMNVWQQSKGNNFKQYGIDVFKRLYKEAMRLTLRCL